MIALTTSLAVRNLRRILSALMCALMLLSAAGSYEVAASSMSAPDGQYEFVVAVDGSGDETDPSGSLPCHSAHHLCGKLPPLPPVLATGVRRLVHPDAKPAGVADRVLLSGVTELPPRPPRA